MAISREIYRDLATQRPEEVSEVRTCSIHFPLPALKCLIICWEVEGRKSDHAGDESRKPSIEVELINVVLALEKRDKILSPTPQQIALSSLPETRQNLWTWLY